MIFISFRGERNEISEKIVHPSDSLNIRDKPFISASVVVVSADILFAYFLVFFIKKLLISTDILPDSFGFLVNDISAETDI